jgi:hypothetical protein
VQWRGVYHTLVLVSKNKGEGLIKIIITDNHFMKASKHFKPELASAGMIAKYDHDYSSAAGLAIRCYVLFSLATSLFSL